jgi:hypothetical protein
MTDLSSLACSGRPRCRGRETCEGDAVRGVARAALLALAALVLAGTASGQGLGGHVRGKVVGPDAATTVAGAIVDLREAASGRVAATMVTGPDGQFTFYGLAEGIYAIDVMLVGFERETTLPFRVAADAPADLVVSLRLTASPQTVDVVGLRSVADEAPGAIDTSMSARLLDVAPVPGSDLLSLMPLLPGVVRGPDGRLLVRGGPPSQGLFVVSSASLVDPSTGDLAFEPPSDAVDRVEVVSSPFAAELGRFTASVTRLRLRSGGERWQYTLNDVLPKPLKAEGGGWRGIKAFTPRLALGGPVRRGRLYLAQSFDARYVRTSVKSLSGWPTIDLRSFDSFTRLDAMASTRHNVAFGFAVFPRAIDRISMATFRPPDTVPNYAQSGFNAGLLDTFVLAPSLVLDTTFSYREHDVDVEPDSPGAMVVAPAGLSGSYFNRQDRHARSLQLVHTATWSAKWLGLDHLVKAGIDLFATSYTGASASAPVEVRRADGSLAERLDFDGASQQDVSGADLSAFVQDQWRRGNRVAVDLGVRVDRDGTIRRVNVSPRAMITVSLGSEGATIVRAGVGHFSQRTPLNIGAFESFERPTVSRFATDGQLLGRYTLLPTRAAVLDTPSSLVGSIEVTRRLSGAAVLKAGYLHRHGENEYLVEPDPALGRMLLSSTGRSRYHEAEVTWRYMRSARTDVSVSYVWSRGRADLNSYDAAYGNVRWPLVRPNEFSLTPTDVPHRILVRGTLGLPWKLDLFPVLEWRTGFPWSAVDEAQQFAGPRNRAGRLPHVATLDFSLSRPVRIRKWDVRLGVRVYRALGTSASRDVQNNTASSDFGRFFNPIRRELGVVFVLGQ